MKTTLKKVILTCLLSGQSFLTIAQYYVHFDKDGKLEEVTQSATVGGHKAYPSILSKEELKFDITQVEVPESSFWKRLQNTSAKLSSALLPSNPSNDILSGLKGTTLSSFTTLLGSPTGALQYDASNLKLPLKVAAPAKVYKVETMEYDRNLNVVSRTPLTLKDRDRIEYTLIRNKLDNDIIQQHLGKTAGSYKGWPTAYDELLLDLRQKFRNQGWDIDAALVHDSLLYTAGTTMHPFKVDILSNLDSLTRSIKLTDTFYRKVLADNKPWIESWLWYTGGEVRLNPFPYADPAKLIGRADQEIKELESEIAAMANREVGLDESGRKDRLAFLLARQQTLKQAREDLDKANDEYTKWLATLSVKSEVVYSGVWHGSDANEIRWLHQFDAARDFRFMNNLKSLPNMVADQDQVVIYTHNLGADDKIAITSALTPFQPKSGLETTTDAIAIELAKAVGGSSSIQGLAQLVAGLNSPAIKDTKPSLPVDYTQSVSLMAGMGNWTQNDFFSAITLIDLRDYVRREIKHSLFSYDKLKSDPIILQKINNSINAALTKAQKNLATAKAVNNSQAEDAAANDIRLAQALIESVKSLQTITKANALTVMYVVFDITDQKAYNELIQSYADSKAELVWLSAQTVPILSISLKPDENPVYHTQADFPEKKVAVESSNEVAYTLMLNDKTTVTQKTYSKYFTSRFMPSFGLVYIPGQRSALSFDETTGQFKPLEKDFDHIEALVGVKWYPWKTNPARTPKTSKLLRQAFNWKANLSRGNNFLNTFYVTGGLGVRRQLLRNYYLGLGIDVIPGLSIQVGSNFIFQKQYELENAKIKNETEVLKPFGYVGLGLDLGLITNLIKILIP